jgi:hypothetical protein
VASAELGSGVLAEVIGRAFSEVPLAMLRDRAIELGLAMERVFAMEVAYAMEGAFSVVAFRCLQRLRLRNLRYPTTSPMPTRPAQHLAQPKIRRPEAHRQKRLRVPV